MKYADFCIATEDTVTDKKKKFETAKLIGYLAATAGLVTAACIPDWLNNRNFRKEMKIKELADKERVNRITRRLNYPTIEEAKSREEYIQSWMPKIQSWVNKCKRDFEFWQKKHDPYKCMLWEGEVFDASFDTSNYIQPLYGARLINCNYNTDNVWWEVYDESPSGDFLVSLEKMIKKWESEAKKFSPHFEFYYDYEDGKRLPVGLFCNHVDDDYIIKPGLPKCK